MIAPDFLLLGLAAAFIWSFSNILDKYVIGSHISDPAAVTFFTSVFGTIFSLILPFFGVVSFSSIIIVISSILLGVLYILPIFLYMKALEIGEVSRIIPVFSTSPAIVVLLGGIFLGEVFDLTTYVGISLVIMGAVMVSSKNLGREFFNLKANKAFWTILSSTVLLAIYSVLTKYLLNFDEFWNIFFWSRIGTLVPTAAILLHSESRKNIASIFKNIKDSKVEYLGLSEFFNNFAVLISTIALSLGPVSLVETAIASQALFVLIIVTVLHRVYDRNIGDDLARKQIIIKTLCAIMIVLGIYLIS